MKWLAPSRVSHHTVDRAYSDNFSAWQGDHVLSRLGVEANPSALDAPLCQLPLSSLYLSIRARLLEGELSEDLLAELSHNANPWLSRQWPSCPTWYRVITNAAWRISQRTIGNFKFSLTRILPSSASTKRLATSTTGLRNLLRSSVRLGIVWRRIAHQRLATWSCLGQCLLQGDCRWLAAGNQEDIRPALELRRLSPAA